MTTPAPHATPTPLTDRVNTEPAIINGMSAPEASYIGWVASVLSLLLSIGLYVLTRFWPVCVLVCICGPILALWYGSLYLQKVKRDRPDGFYVQAVHIRLADHGIIRCRFNRHRRFYEIGVRMKLMFNPPLELGADLPGTPSTKP